MPEHFNGQVYIQKVQPEEPAKLGAYEKVVEVARPRVSHQIVEIKLQGATKQQLIASLIAHLNLEGDARA